jgi:hypothetical protein
VEEVLETITLEAATVQEAVFGDATAPASAEGFRIIELGRMNEVLRWTRGDVQPP